MSIWFIENVNAFNNIISNLNNLPQDNLRSNKYGATFS